MVFRCLIRCKAHLRRFNCFGLEHITVGRVLGGISYPMDYGMMRRWVEHVRRDGAPRLGHVNLTGFDPDKPLCPGQQRQQSPERRT